jgi:hypothetical protein
MNRFNAFENLNAKAKSRAERKCTSRLTATQFSQVFPLQLHHNVIKPIVTTTANKSTDVLLPCKSQSNKIIT